MAAPLRIALPGSPEKKLEGRHAQKVLRLLAQRLNSFGFARTKASFFTRSRPWVIEFVHVHKFRFGPAFRVHLGIRVRNEHFPAAHLNGPAAENFPVAARGDPAVSFRFDSDPRSLDSCATAMAGFVEAEGLAWFEAFRCPESLLSSESPLAPAAQTDLRRALEDPGEAVDSATTLQVLNAAAARPT
jgi:hypothetical protein